MSGGSTRERRGGTRRFWKAERGIAGSVAAPTGHLTPARPTRDKAGPGMATGPQRQLAVAFHGGAALPEFPHLTEKLVPCRGASFA